MSDEAGVDRATGGAGAEGIDDVEAARARVDELIDGEAAVVAIAEAIEDQDAPDAADSLERLEPEDSAEVLQEMEDLAAAEALAHMVPALAASVFPDLSDADAARLLEMMAPDDAADILPLLPEARRAELIGLMHPKRAAVLGQLVKWDPESAAGIMTTEIGVVRRGLTIGQAIGFLKHHKATEDQHELYVVDEEKRLIGAISLRDLLVIDDDEAVSGHMRDVDHPLRVEMDREDVAREFSRYDLVTAPVLDERGRVLGMVTIDDVVDIIEAEAAEDALKQVGAAGDEAVHSGLRKKLRSRVPWLLVNLVTSQAAAAVILLANDLIELIPLVAAVFPVIANEAGNAGMQSFALTLRGLVSGEVRADLLGRLLVREAMFGLVAGLVIGVVFAAVLAALGLGGVAGAGWRLGAVAGVAMAGSLWAACLAGVTMPIAMERIGVDPASASSIFLTMITDVVAFSTFLGLVFVAKDWILAAGG